MSLIYKGFSRDVPALGKVCFPPHSVMTAFGRAYIAKGKPYFDNVHFEGLEQPWCIVEKIHHHIKDTPSLHGRVYAGAAGEVNLSNIALSKAPAAILFDINPLQTVFWNDFFSVMARCPEPEDFARAMRRFSHDLYFKLRHEFNIEAICKERPGLHMRSPDPKDHMVPVETQIARAKEFTKSLQFEFTKEQEQEIIKRGPICDHNPEENNSPFRNMSYKEFYRWFASHLGWKEGYIWMGEKELHWLTNRALYRHLHLMAKFDAIAPLTLDICDAQGCAQLLEFLNQVEYLPVEIGRNNIEKTHNAGRGARFGMINFSNICYYLMWTQQEMEEEKAKGGTAFDFTGRDVDAQSWRKTLENWRPLVTPDAAILRFDRITKGILGRPDFNPTFKVMDGVPIHIPTPLEKGGLVLEL